MSKLPLWEVMADTFDETATVACRDFSRMLARCKAAEIRALRDWLVPEEDPLPDSVHGGNRYARQSERQRLRALLTAEADRAERGEVEA